MIIVYSCLFDDYDSVKNFIVPGDKDIRFILFTDSYKHENWEIINIDYDTIDEDPQRAARDIKILSHKYLPEHDYSIWIDSSIELNILYYKNLIERFLDGEDVFMFRHGNEGFARNCSYGEARWCIKAGLDDKLTLMSQIRKYKEDKFPSNYGLCSTGFIIRRNTPKVKKFNETWHEQVCEYSKRDQVSVMYSAWKSKTEISTIERNNEKKWSVYDNPYMKKHKHNKTDRKLFLRTNLNFKETFQIVLGHLDFKIPMSLVRVGDGESRILQGSGSDAQFVYKRQFGYMPASVALIKKEVAKAYDYADIIGFPDARHLKRDKFWKSAKKMVLEKAPNAADAKKCSIDVVYQWDDDKLFEQLLRDRKRIFYLSGRNLDDWFKKTYGIEEVVSFIITPEMLFEENKDQDRHYPEQFEKAKKWIFSQKCEGDLCLIGAGILGKVYTGWFKQAGGVAVDIGSMFDKWANKKTRGSEKEFYR